MAEKLNIKGLTIDALTSWCIEYGLRAYRANQINEWIWIKGVSDFDEMNNLPLDTRLLLREHFIIGQLAVEDEQQSSDGTEKISFCTVGGNLIEGVLIPSEDRTTACISTQAGCALACKFCATGLLGFQQQLDAWEIYDQVFYINELSIRKFGHPLSNIVYMGMGEPFLNFDAVRDSIERLTDPVKGLGMSPQRITVSTVGIPDGIRRFAQELPRVQLALSLHSANQKKREQLMPVAKKHSLDEITEALKNYHEVTSGRVTLEYILLNEINDTDKDMHDLARFCKSFPVKINLIPYNSVGDSGYADSGKEKTLTFIRFLKDKNLVVNARKSRGSDIAAACGQLARQGLNNKNI